MKIAPIMSAISEFNHHAGPDRVIDQKLVHTGQHYDEKMSKLFFEDLQIPKPDINLGVGSGSHAKQTAEIMNRFEDVCEKENPTHVLVVGDVNSTIACALVASKLGVRVVHVEAGLRSFDRTMPEEINRVLTDAISDILFTTEESANENLKREGVPGEKIHFVGNVMIDTLLKHQAEAHQSRILKHLGLNSLPPDQGRQAAPYAVLTLHRPSNVDDRQTLQGILEALQTIAADMPVIFPAHPRTLNRIREFGFKEYFEEGASNITQFKIKNSKLKIGSSGIRSLPPLGYLDFLCLMSNAQLVFTDSGGIQEEATILSVPCITLRENTERPVTCTNGTNVIAGTEKGNILSAARNVNNARVACTPPLWDGKASERIVEILEKEIDEG